MRKILATVLVAMFMSFIIAPAALAGDSPMSIYLKKGPKVAPDEFDDAVRSTAAGGICAGITRIFSRDWRFLTGAAALCGGGTYVASKIKEKKDIRKNEQLFIDAQNAEDAKNAALRKEDHDWRMEEQKAAVRNTSTVETQFTQFNARFDALDARLAAATAAPARNGDNVVVNAGIGASQAPAMITVENCLPAQFTKTQVYDDYVGAWRRLETRERRSVSTTNPEATPKVRTWWSLPGGGEGWIELRVGDGLARISTGYWRIQ